MSIQDSIHEIEEFQFNFDKEMVEINNLINEVSYYEEKKRENNINQVILNYFIFIYYFITQLNYEEKKIIEYEKYFYSSNNLYYQYLNLFDFLIKVILLNC